MFFKREASVTNHWNTLLAELYGSPDLMNRFLAHPAEVLREKGIPLPEGIEIKALADTASVRHVVIPYLDPEGETATEQIETRSSKIVM